MKKRTERMKVQVFKDNEWKWVFCSNDRDGVITCKSKGLALKARDLSYFENKYQNHKFRLV